MFTKLSWKFIVVGKKFTIWQVTVIMTPQFCYFLLWIYKYFLDCYKTKQNEHEEIKNKIQGGRDMQSVSFFCSMLVNFEKKY